MLRHEVLRGGALRFSQGLLACPANKNFLLLNRELAPPGYQLPDKLELP